MRADVEVQQLDLVQRKIAARAEQPASYVVALCILGTTPNAGDEKWLHCGATA